MIVSPQHYYQLALSNQGTLRPLEHGQAKQFIEQSAPNTLWQARHNKAEINEWHLLLWLRSQNTQLNDRQRIIATTCLRCYVSWCLDKVAKQVFRYYQDKQLPQPIQLEEIRQQFLGDANINLEVTLHDPDNSSRRIFQELTSSGGLRTYTVYKPLSFTILETWEPMRELAHSLENWVYRKATSANVMKQLGIDRRTPWHRLCYSPKRKIKALASFHQAYVAVFQQVYLPELQNHRRSPRGKYPQPTQNQLARMEEILRTTHNIQDLSPEKVYDMLVEIAKQLRDQDTNPELIYQSLQENNSSSDDLTPDTIHELLQIISELGGEAEIVKNAACETFRLHKQLLHRRLIKHNVSFEDICHLYYGQGMNQTAIAKKLDCDQATISRILNRKLCLENTVIQYIDTIMKSARNNIFFGDELDEIAELEEYIREEIFQKSIYNQVLRSMFS